MKIYCPQQGFEPPIVQRTPTQTALLRRDEIKNEHTRLRTPRFEGRPLAGHRRIQENNIKMDLTETERRGVKWIQLAQNGDQ
jgi:hypothetical protein